MSAEAMLLLWPFSLSLYAVLLAYELRKKDWTMAAIVAVVAVVMATSPETFIGALP